VRSLLKSCVSGLGVALLPNMMIAADLDAGRLKLVLPDYLSEGGTVSVLLPSREQVPPAVSAFIEFATARLETLIGNQAHQPARSRRRA
jgi:LysR family transcriptional regulator AphB